MRFIEAHLQRHLPATAPGDLASRLRAMGIVRPSAVRAPRPKNPRAEIPFCNSFARFFRENARKTFLKFPVGCSQDRYTPPDRKVGVIENNRPALLQCECTAEDTNKNQKLAAKPKALSA